MRKCEEIRELMSLYLDDMLDENTIKDIKKHIESCEECRVELNTLRKIINIVRTIEEEDLPVDYSSNLHEKLLEEKRRIDLEKRKKAWYKNWRIYSAVAAAFLIVVLFKANIFGLTQDFYVGNTRMESADTAAPVEDKLQTEAQLEKSTNQKELKKDEEPKMGIMSEDLETIEEGNNESTYDLKVTRESHDQKMDRSLQDNGSSARTNEIKSHKVIVKCNPNKLDRVLLELENNPNLTYVLDYYLNNQIVIIDLLKSDYEKFIGFLNDIDAVNDISVNMKDMSNQYEEYLLEYEKLRDKASKLESNGNLSELDKVKEEIDKLENKINTIQYYSDKTVVQLDAGLAE